MSHQQTWPGSTMDKQLQNKVKKKSLGFECVWKHGNKYSDGEKLTKRFETGVYSQKRYIVGKCSSCPTLAHGMAELLWYRHSCQIKAVFIDLIKGLILPRSIQSAFNLQCANFFRDKTVKF